MQLASFKTPQHQALTEPDVALAHAHVEPRIPPWDEFFAGETLDDFLWRMTVESLDDIGACQYSREVESDEPYRRAISSEQRLLAQLDAALCFGPALERRFTEQLPELDTPARFFAQAITASAVDASWSLGMLESCLRAALEVDEEAMAWVVAALCLGSHPRTGELARHLLADADARVRVAGAEVLGFRNEAQARDLLPLLHDAAPEVIAAALHALRHVQVSGDELHDVVSLIDHGDARVVERAIRTGLCKQSGRAHAHARKLCAEGRFAHAPAALCLSAAGHEDDGPEIVSWLSASDDPQLITAAGYLGLPETVPALLAHLEAKEPTTREAAARALARITGAPATETVEKPLYGPEDEEFVENPSAITSVERVLESRAEWSARWKAESHRFTEGQRYRGGRALDISVILAALEHGPSRRMERTMADLELRIIAGERAPHLELRDWVPKQQAAIEGWREWVENRVFSLRRGFVRART